MPRELAEQPEPPPELMYLIQWLGQLVCPVTFTELQAFASISGVRLARREIDALIALDRIRNG